jgi:hypothetical protein
LIFRRALKDEPRVLEDPTIKKLAADLGKTPAQVSYIQTLKIHDCLISQDDN